MIEIYLTGVRSLKEALFTSPILEPVTFFLIRKQIASITGLTFYLHPIPLPTPSSYFEPISLDVTPFMEPNLLSSFDETVLSLPVLGLTQNFSLS
jgi:hypothetical protein